jgi:hypothetical protein
VNASRSLPLSHKLLLGLNETGRPVGALPATVSGGG